MPSSRWRLLIAVLAVAMAAAACGTDDPLVEESPTVPEGPSITVASNDFNESVLLAEVYAQALEAAGYTVERSHRLGTRENTFAGLNQTGEIDLIPEYVGGALSSGFQVSDIPDDRDAAFDLLVGLFEAEGITVAERSQAEDTDAFVVMPAFATEHGVSKISDLDDVEGTVRFAGLAECEVRETCYVGLTDVYGLTNVTFAAEPQDAIRFERFDAGDYDMVQVFSTAPVIAEKGYVLLEDDLGITPDQTVVPVIRTSLVETYGQAILDVLNAVSAALTTAELTEMNAEVENPDNPADPAAVAAAWLADNDLA